MSISCAANFLRHPIRELLILFYGGATRDFETAVAVDVSDVAGGNAQLLLLWGCPRIVITDIQITQTAAIADIFLGGFVIRLFAIRP